MIAKSYARLSMIPLLVLVLGFIALAMPAPWQGPMVFRHSLTAGPTTGLMFLMPTLYFADALGLLLLSLATLEIFVIALAWEHRCRSCLK